VWNANGWHLNPDTHLIDSIDPSTGEVLDKVHAATSVQLTEYIESAQIAFQQWREVPAPQRGEIVRLMREELGRHKDALATLVTLATGKIKAEGTGEVQEMIDIADFAVGQSRMLYGRTMHSERPQHRMYEPWHPLGVVAIISAFHFPVAVWAWNAFLAAVCGNVCIWKPSPTTPLCALAVQRIVNRVLERTQSPAIFQLLITDDNAVTEQLVDDPHVDLVSFTGSTAVGRQVATYVAARARQTLARARRQQCNHRR
jgi:aldehyde dehydrogenase (NAD+)